MQAIDSEDSKPVSAARWLENIELIGFPESKMGDYFRYWAMHMTQPPTTYKVLEFVNSRSLRRTIGENS